jgi:Cu(I)/Ag(I) efflux system membrane protein CusA/SilA
MFETTITFKPKEQWRPGMTMAKIKDELDKAVHVPGLTNLFVPPIRNRIDMLATGIKSPIGIKVLGTDLDACRSWPIESRRRQERARRSSAIAERPTSGRYVDVHYPSGRCGTLWTDAGAQVQQLIATVVGGDPIGQTVEGRERYPIVVRYPRAERDSVESLRAITDHRSPTARS